MNREELIALEGRLETVKDWMNGLRMVAAHPIARQAAIHMTVIEAALTALQSREEVVRECAATAEQCFDYGPDTKDPQRAYFLGRADAGRAIRKLLEPK